MLDTTRTLVIVVCLLKCSRAETFGATPKCGEEDQKGKFMCVPYFNCDLSTNTVVDYPEVDGSDTINPRRTDSYKCDHFLEICCQIPNATMNEVVHNIPAVDFKFAQKCGVKGTSDSPWMVALTEISKEEADIPFCGGSLLSPVVVLTAAHCVKDYKAYQIKVLAGTSSYQAVNVAAIIIFEHHLSSTFYNDVALLVLNNSLTGNIGTVCLPREKDIKNIDTENCFVTSWGRTGENETDHSRILKKLQVSTITNRNCQKILRTKLGEEFILDRSFICANGNHTCMGDGGSPLVCPDSSQRYFQMGIVSWGIGSCGKESIPDVYTNVAQFRNWVDYKMVEIGYTSEPYTL